MLEVADSNSAKPTKDLFFNGGNMTREEVEEQFPVGCKVKLKEHTTREYAAPAGSLAVVTGYNHSYYSTSICDLLVKWIAEDNTQQHGDYDYRDFEIFVDFCVGGGIKEDVKLCPRCKSKTTKVMIKGLLTSTTEEQIDKCFNCGWCN